MSTHGSRHRLILAVLLTSSPAAAPSQTAGERTTVLEVPIPGPTGPSASFVVSRVDRDGTVQLRVPAAVPADARRALTGSIREAYYLILMAPRGKSSAQPVVLRAQVTDIAEGPALTARIAPEAVAGVRPGDGVQLVRPLGSTTAALRSLPAVIPITEDRVAAAATAANAASRAKSIDNLVRIGLALHNYLNAKEDRFPPAVVYGPDGKPWHSWRVLILPYLGQDDLYRSYDFNQPWDSPKNRKLLDRMPDVYREPAYGESRGSFAHYAALVGKDTCFPSDRPIRPDDTGGRWLNQITDGTSNCIMVAPVEPGRKIPWTKPEDIAVGPDFRGLGKPGGIATPYTLGGKPGAVGVAPILFADGSVHLVAPTIDRRTLNALLSANGGEVILRDAIPEDPSPLRPASRVLKIQVTGNTVTTAIEDAPELPKATPVESARKAAVEKRRVPDRFGFPPPKD